MVFSISRSETNSHGRLYRRLRVKVKVAEIQFRGLYTYGWEFNWWCENVFYANKRYECFSQKPKFLLPPHWFDQKSIRLLPSPSTQVWLLKMGLWNVSHFKVFGSRENQRLIFVSSSFLLHIRIWRHHCEKINTSLRLRQLVKFKRNSFLTTLVGG